MAKKQNKQHGNQQHDWEALKKDYMSSQHVSVRSWIRAHFKIKKGVLVPSYYQRKTKGRAQDKKDLAKLALEEARDEVKETQREEWVDTLNRAGRKERDLVEHICDIVEFEISKKKKYKDRAISLQKMEFLLKALRTVQGKANEYLGDEIETETELDKIMREQGYLPAKKQG